MSRRTLGHMSDHRTSSPVERHNVKSLNQWQPIVGKSHETMRAWVHKGWLIPTVNTGTFKLFDAAAINAAIDRYEKERRDEADAMRASVAEVEGAAA